MRTFVFLECCNYTKRVRGRLTRAEAAIRFLHSAKKAPIKDRVPLFPSIRTTAGIEFNRRSIPPPARFAALLFLLFCVAFFLQQPTTHAATCVRSQWIGGANSSLRKTRVIELNGRRCQSRARICPFISKSGFFDSGNSNLRVREILVYNFRISSKDLLILRHGSFFFMMSEARK